MKKELLKKQFVVFTAVLLLTKVDSRLWGFEMELTSLLYWICSCTNYLFVLFIMEKFWEKDR